MKLHTVTLAAALLVCTAARLPAQQAAELWSLGGTSGRAWRDWVQLNVMADVSSAGRLMPLELRPDVNLMPVLLDQVTFSYWQIPFNPYWVDAMPRFWRGFPSKDSLISIHTGPNLIDGDPDTFQSQLNYLYVREEWFTIDLGTLAPLERFVVRMPPGTDALGEPWANYVPKHGELTASQEGASIAVEALPGESRRYRQLNPRSAASARTCSHLSKSSSRSNTSAICGGAPSRIGNDPTAPRCSRESPTPISRCTVAASPVKRAT